MMPDEDKTTIEGSDADKSEETVEKKKGSSKLILFGGIGLGAIVIGVVLAIFVIMPMMSDSESAYESDEIAQAENADDAEKEAPKPKKKKKKRKKKNKDGEEIANLIYAVKDIVINPAGTGGSRFLSISFGFELESAELHADFENREPIIRDALITIMSSKTVAQLTDPKQKEIVRYQIKKRLMKLMETDELVGVYYTDFVLQ
jgi:flagellar FliL protein